MREAATTILAGPTAIAMVVNAIGTPGTRSRATCTCRVDRRFATAIASTPCAAPNRERSHHGFFTLSGAPGRTRNRLRRASASRGASRNRPQPLREVHWRAQGIRERLDCQIPRHSRLTQPDPSDLHTIPRS